MVGFSLKALAFVLNGVWAQGAYAPIELPPGTEEVLLNIGSSLRPVVPAADAVNVVSIAFEPMLSVAARIEAHPQLRVVPCAVAASDGLRTLTRYNNDGISSSLGRATTDAFWNNNKTRGDGVASIVPVLSFRTVLDAIPYDVGTPYLKTDMQGADFEAIASVPHAVLRRIPHLLTEVWVANTRSYAGFENDLCRDWMPHMDAAGYRLVYLRIIEADSMPKDATIRDKWSQAWMDDPRAMCDDDFQKHPDPIMGIFEADAHWIRQDVLDKILRSDPSIRMPPVRDNTDWPITYPAYGG